MVGTFAVLRRRALTGDVVAHSALPGLCIAFLLFESKSILVLLSGALLSGLLGAVTVSILTRLTKLKDDAVQGIVLSVFYGTGIALTRVVQNNYRNSNESDLESFLIGRAATMVKTDVLQIAGVTLAVSIVVLLLYKELKLLSFDRQFCTVQGLAATPLDLTLMLLTAVTVVVGLPAVGVVLMAALLIIPPAAARFWTDRLSTMMTIASIFGALSGIAGTVLSAKWDGLPTGPLIVLASTSLFLLSWIFAPHRGIISSLRRSTLVELEAELPWNQSVPVAGLPSNSPQPNPSPSNAGRSDV
ncbi:UNVERIFIED_CONTAM: hypothetical protein GTU68_050265 [Idotea baltica]|nr:hypothetical protein [Idotea baltica]